ncbi:MAG TPA: DUF222 domain-containing protein, partial [Acidimicrobiales bacterium]
PVDRAVDGLAELDPDTLDDLTLTDTVVELRRVRARLAAVQARLIDAVDRRRPWAEDGYLSTAAWLAASDNTAVGEAHRQVRLARRLRSMPATAAGLGAADITAAHAQRLAALAGPATAARFAGAEEFLVGQARTMRWADFTRACAYWARLARDEAPDADAADREHRHVTLHDGLRGTGLLTGELTPVAKATVRRALERIEADLFHADWAAARAEHGAAATPADLARTPGQRRHDALVEMATRSATAPPDGKRPAPLVSVLTGYQAFTRICELADGTLVSPGTVASLLDDAVIERVVLDGPSRVLDLGRARSFTGAARRAVEITQRHCDGPGCHTPAHRCHIDHIWRHADGGPTRPDNGRTLCGPHNRDRERPHPRRRSPSPRQPPPPTPDQQTRTLELLRKRIRDRLHHDPTWADPTDHDP